MQRPRSKETRDELTFGERIKKRRKYIYTSLPNFRTLYLRSEAWCEQGYTRSIRCCSSIHRVGFGILYKLNARNYIRVRKLRRSKGSLPSLAFKRNLPLHPSPSTKTQQNWHASYRVTETWAEGEGAEREGYASRGEGYARTEMREEGEEGGWQTGLLAPPSFRFPASGSLQ